MVIEDGDVLEITPDEAEVWYFIRSPERYQVDELTLRVRNIAEARP